MILINLVNHYAAYGVDDEAFSRKQRSIERLRPLFAFLDEHYSEAISLDQAAGLVHMSKSHFLHFMKQVTGLSFVSYLNQFRIAKAQELLIKSDKSIAEIGQGVGFCDQSYFGNVFRKLLHMSPSQYRLQGELPAADPVSAGRLQSQSFSILLGGRDSVRR
jgi:AraC-like DNA-binding protein